jgi:AcrR family transcriptional regulator
MIYYYFRSKDDLYRAVISSYLGRASKMITSAIDQSLEMEEFLLSISDTYARIFHLAGPFRSILLRELAGGDPEIIRQIADALSETQLAKKISSYLHRGIEEGHLRAVDIRQAVFSFIAMNVGFMLLAPLAGRILDVSDTHLFVQERKRAVVDLFLHGVKARQE